MGEKQTNRRNEMTKCGKCGAEENHKEMFLIDDVSVCYDCYEAEYEAEPE